MSGGFGILIDDILAGVGGYLYMANDSLFRQFIALVLMLSPIIFNKNAWNDK